MNDPNYFAMTQIITLVLAYKYIHNYIFKVLACGILLWSLTTTGSKTAFIILIVLAIYFFIKKLFGRNGVSVEYVSDYADITLFSFIISTTIYSN